MEWSAPYSFDFHSNKLKLWGYTLDMLNYEKSERYYYYNMVPTQIVLNNRFRMLGIMGTDHHPNVKVSILPERSSDMFVEK